MSTMLCFVFACFLGELVLLLSTSLLCYICMRCLQIYRTFEDLSSKLLNRTVARSDYCKSSAGEGDVWDGEKLRADYQALLAKISGLAEVPCWRKKNLVGN